MMTNETLLAQPIFQALGWALLHFIWQGALVALLYASLSVILRRRASYLRYAAACGALLLMLALPIATALVIRRALPRQSVAAQTTSTPARELSRNVETTRATQTPVTETTFETASLTTAQPAQEAEAPVVRQRMSRLLPWLVSIWLAGVVLLSLRVLGGYVLAQRLKSWKTAPVTREWQEKLEQLARRLSVSRPVRLCESIVAEVPTVIGWLRPVILVPVSAFVGLSPQQIEALLAHELAHIRRHDYLINLIQTAVETLLFYHPAVWWVSRQIRAEREHCCDDLAVAACGNVLTYARALAELEHLRASAFTPQLVVAADGGTGSLLSRIQRLVGKPSSPHQRSSAWLASIVAIATIFCICVGARTTLFNPADSEQPRPAGSYSLLERTLSGGTIDLIAEPAQGAATEKSETILSGIKESVTVIASAQEEIGEATQPDALPKIAGSDPVDGIMPGVATTPGNSSVLPQTMPFVAAQEDKDEDGDKPSGSYIDALAAAGYTNLSVDQLIEMRNHGVSPSYIRELKALGYQSPSVDSLIRLVDHGVSIGFIKRLAELGYRNLALDELVEARDHGVSGEVIEALNAAGYSNLSMDLIVRTIDHGVSPSYIKAMSEIGFSKLSLEQLIRMVDHGVGPSYVKEIRALGYEKLTAEQFIRLRDHGVSAAFVRKARERGFNNLTLEELIKLRDADIL